MKKAKSPVRARVARFPAERIERFQITARLRAEADSEGFISLWVYSSDTQSWAPAYLEPKTALALVAQLGDLISTAAYLKTEAGK